MAAGLGFKTFNTGDVLSAADTNGYLMQGVLVFANATARDAAITSPQEGQCCYLKDTDAVQTYSGSAWVGFDDSNAIQNSIVDAKGDIVAASGNDTPARLAVGTSGSVLVSDTAASTGLNYIPSLFAGKNLVINGDFGIWQRGTSFTSTNGTGFFGADRFNIYSATTGRTFSRQNTSPNGSSYFIRIQRDSGNTNTSALSIFYTLETAQSKPLAGKTLTLSFYARAGANFSAASSTMFSPAVYGTGTDQNQIAGFTGSASIANQGNVLTTSWQRFTMTGTVNAAATQVGFQLVYTPVGTAGAADYMDIADVQWEVGSTATSFQTATGTLQGELAACQRYYFRFVAGNDGYIFGTSYNYNTTNGIAAIKYPVSMRIRPTALEQTGTASDYGIWQANTTVQNLNAVPVFNGSTNTEIGVVNGAVAANLTASTTTYLVAKTTTAYLGWSAEL